MKKQIYFVFSILMIALLVQTAEAKDFKFIPANTDHIMDTAKQLKNNPELEIEIFGYVETLTKDNDTKIIEEVLVIRECYLNTGIDEIRITIGLGNKGGIMEEKYKFQEDGVYIRLSYKLIK